MNSLIPSISPGETFYASPWRAPGLPVSSQKEREKKKLLITADILWSLPSAPCKAWSTSHKLPYQAVQWGCKSTKGHVECHIMTKKSTTSRFAVCLGFLELLFFN